MRYRERCSRNEIRAGPLPRDSRGYSRVERGWTRAETRASHGRYRYRVHEIAAASMTLRVA